MRERGLIPSWCGYEGKGLLECLGVRGVYGYHRVRTEPPDSQIGVDIFAVGGIVC